jgi:hypothetical protein
MDKSDAAGDSLVKAVKVEAEQIIKDETMKDSGAIGKALAATMDQLKKDGDALFERVKIVAEQLVKDGFNLEQYMAEQNAQMLEWEKKRIAEVGKEKSDDEAGYFGGLCPTCGHRMPTFDFINNMYCVCYGCKTHEWAEFGYQSDAPIEKQAKYYLVLENTREIK